jgi:hypothetical protein
MKPQRSLRLEKRSAKSLDTLSGASGEIFYDVDSATLRIYTNNANEKVVLATRSWTTTEIENNAFSGLYADLIGAPTALSSFTNNVGYITLADLPPAETGGAVNINDLLDVEIDTPALGQLLEYDGAKWINTTVSGLTDTNTTYSLDLTSTTNGVDLDLVDSNAISDIITILGGTGINVSITNTNEVTIDNTGAAPAMNDISDVTVALPEDGHVLQYNSGLWINTAPTGGIALTDFSVSTGAASGSGSLSYDNVNGVFTFTPPDVSAAGIALTDLSILTSTANAGGSLTYNNTTGEFTFRPADLSGISADLVNDTTPQLGGALELNTNNIVGSGNIDITGAGTFTDTVSAPEFINTGVGAPTITSASTITLTAPDGVTIDGDLDVTGTVTTSALTSASTITLEAPDGIILDSKVDGDITLEADRSLNNNGDSIVALTLPYGNSFEEAFKLVGIVNTLTFDLSSQSFAGITYTATGNPAIALKIKSETGLHVDALLQETTSDLASFVSNAIELDTTLASHFQCSDTITANYTINITNIAELLRRTQTIALRVQPSSFSPIAITVNGTNRTVLWEGGSPPPANGIVNVYTFELGAYGGANPQIFASMKAYS